jgi:hypothetical protein
VVEESLETPNTAAEVKSTAAFEAAVHHRKKKHHGANPNNHGHSHSHSRGHGRKPAHSIPKSNGVC